MADMNCKTFIRRFDSDRRLHSFLIFTNIDCLFVFSTVGENVGTFCQTRLFSPFEKLSPRGFFISFLFRFFGLSRSAFAPGISALLATRKFLKFFAPKQSPADRANLQAPDINGKNHLKPIIPGNQRSFPCFEIDLELSGKRKQYTAGPHKIESIPSLNLVCDRPEHLPQCEKLIIEIAKILRADFAFADFAFKELMQLRQFIFQQIDKLLRFAVCFLVQFLVVGHEVGRSLEFNLQVADFRSGKLKLEL